MSRACAWAVMLSCALGSCSDGGRETCDVRGVVVDVQDGEPLVGIRVEGPDGVRAVTDPRGRFILKGLQEGEEGLVKAWRSDGWEAQVPLKAVKAGEMNIVLHLSPR